LYFSTNIIRVIKWKSIKLLGHVACMGEVRNALEHLMGRDHLGDISSILNRSLWRRIQYFEQITLETYTVFWILLFPEKKGQT
jgi:hypothetical protein